MSQRNRLRDALALLAMLAIALLVPLHLSDEHLEAVDLGHGGADHDDSDHEDLTLARVATPTTGVEPAALQATADDATEPLPAILPSSGGVRHPPPPAPPSFAHPPAPTRGPPTLRS